MPGFEHIKRDLLCWVTQKIRARLLFPFLASSFTRLYPPIQGLSVLLKVLVVLPKRATFFTHVLKEVFLLFERAPFAQAQSFTELIEVVALAFRAFYLHQATQNGAPSLELLLRNFGQQLVEPAFLVGDFQIKTKLCFLHKVQVTYSTYLVAGKADQMASNSAEHVEWDE